MADLKIAKIIEKKENGQKLTADEINFSMKNFLKPDADRSQISNFFMSSIRRGLDKDETTKLTNEFSTDGSVLPQLEEWIHVVADTIGTTGVRNIVNLVLAPVLAAIGFKVLVISGKSLEYTGNFRNYLECIPKFRVCLSLNSICEVLNSSGCCIVGKTVEFDPADKLLCQCQEMTEITSDCKYSPLIIAATVSKNCCEEITALLYDVKYGAGSIFNTKSDAEETAGNLVQNSRCKKTTAFLTSMEHPYGRRIGNSVEITEAILFLKGHGSHDINEFVCALGTELLQLTRGTSKEIGTIMIMDVIKNGMALEKFQSMIIHQGLQAEIAHLLCYTNGFFILPKSAYQIDIGFDGEDGYVQEINFLNLAMIYKKLSAKCNRIAGVGLMLLKCVGDKIKRDEIWIKINHQRSTITNDIQDLLKNSISVGENQKKRILIDKIFSTAINVF